jgi:asparagine synthase (glutamine-hydrolysing)
MCGITGFWRPPGSRGDDADELIRVMTCAIAHRGPDADGIWLDQTQGIALGHRRLAIRDLSAAGNQPMVSANGRHVLVFNGEIYNSEEMRVGLERLGPLAWRGSSDTEVFIESVGRIGLGETLRQAVGMFALALWDREELKLTLVRDRFGEKPLYFSELGDAVVFGSELKALSRFPGMPSEPGAESISLYLRYGYVPAPLTIIDGVHKLEPGQVISFCRKARRVEGNRWKYWRPEEDLQGEQCGALPFFSLRAAADGAAAVLESAVRRQLVADVPVGAFLSGGIDSSLIVGLMARVSGRRPKTFTIGFEDARFDEAPNARAVARHLDTDHFEEYVGNRQLFEIIPQLPYIYDEPIGDSSCIPTALISVIARSHVKVVLSGDGGDELFAGYNHYRWGPWVDRAARSVPGFLRSSVKSYLVSSGRLLRQRRLVRLGESVGALPAVNPLLLLNANIPDLDGLVPKILPERAWYVAPKVTLPPAQRIMAFDLHGHLPGDILMKVDRASMHVGLECRAPFLDHEVAAFACGLPMQYLGNRYEGKLVLKELLSRMLPRQLFDRPKAGFGLPLGTWMLTDLKSVVERYLLHFPSRYEVWLRREGVRRLFEEHQTGVVDRQRELWTIFTLLMWLEARGL